VPDLVGKDEVVSIHDPAGGCMERLSCSLGPHKQRRQLRSPVGWISTFNILLTLTGVAIRMAISAVWRRADNESATFDGLLLGVLERGD
jgi:hypothetical protein